MNNMWLWLKDTIPWALPVIIFLSCVFEWTKIPINPISSLFKWIACKVTSPTDEKIDKLEKKIDEKFDSIVYVKSEHYKEITDSLKDMKVQIKDLSDIGDEREMKRLRARVLVFAEDLRNGKKKSKESFHNIMEVHNDYCTLIEKHNLHNGVIDEEYGYILEEYRRCREEADFLSS